MAGMPPAGPQQEQQQQQSVSMLLALPEPCLLAVLQCLATDGNHRSLCSAARAHSRLHQAAVLVLSSIALKDVQEQQQIDSLLLYLDKHGQHVSSLRVAAADETLSNIDRSTLTLRQLPPRLQLGSLQLHQLNLQLQPGNGFQGVLGSAAELSALKQLQLTKCVLHDGQKGLEAALALLPGLQQLSIEGIYEEEFEFPPDFEIVESLAQMQQLDYLSLVDTYLYDLQPLHALQQLVELRLLWPLGCGHSVTACVLSGMSRLTRLEVGGTDHFEPSALAGMKQLRHLSLSSCELMPESVGQAQLLSHLQPLQQLTHLCIAYCCRDGKDTAAPVAAYSALTASTLLRHLDLSEYLVPGDGWGRVFSSGRQLPHLTSLFVVNTWDSLETISPCIVGSCPGLQHLDVCGLVYIAGAFTPLQGLSGLRTLELGMACNLNTRMNPLHPTGSASIADAVLCEVGHLTGLRRLVVHSPEDDGLLQVSSMKHLTELTWHRCRHPGWEWVSFTQAPRGDPVWLQVLHFIRDFSHPAVAQQAAAALAKLKKQKKTEKKKRVAELLP